MSNELRVWRYLALGQAAFPQPWAREGAWSLRPPLLIVSAAPAILHTGYCNCFVTCVPASATILRTAARGNCSTFTRASSHFLKTLPQFPFSSGKESTSLGWPTSPSPSTPLPRLCLLLRLHLFPAPSLRSQAAPSACSGCSCSQPRLYAPRLLPLPAALSLGICMITTLLLKAFTQLKLPWWPYSKSEATLPPGPRHSWSCPTSSLHLATSHITCLIVMCVAVCFYTGRSLFVPWYLLSSENSTWPRLVPWKQTNKWGVCCGPGAQNDRWWGCRGRNR